MVMSAVSASWKLGFYSPTDRKTEALFFLMVTFQRNGSQGLEKDTPKLQEIHIYLTGTEEGFTIVNPLSKFSMKG